jgi:hypothetical protein
MEFRIKRISISDYVDGEWIETFKIETSAEQQVVRDIAAVFLGLGTERERRLEELLKEKNNE